jgi:hypothetical protein
MPQVRKRLSLLGNRPAADMVDPFLKILPISPATRNCLISFRPHYGFQYHINTDGITPAPLVGAVTILPKAALTSFTDKTAYTFQDLAKFHLGQSDLF